MILQRTGSGYSDHQGNKYSLKEAQRMLDIANNLGMDVIVRNNKVRERIKYKPVFYIDELLGYIAQPKENTIEKNKQALLEKGFAEDTAMEYIKAIYKSKLGIKI